MHHLFLLLSYPTCVFVVVDGCVGWKCTILSAELAVSRVFERSLKPDQSTRATGTGFWRVQNSQPVPQVNPWQNPRVLKTRDIP